MKTIDDNNKLIAEFEGHQINYGFKNNGILFLGQHIGVEELKYNESYNWLMGTVAHIESLELDFVNGELILESIGNRAKFILDDGTRIFDDNVAETKLEAIYLSVIQFIKWYNQKKEYYGR